MTVVEQIVRREVDAVILYETDNVIAFLDHDPINLGHALICPKKPYHDFIDVPEDVMAEILLVARAIYRKIVKKYSSEGVSLLQNNGSFNELKHFHLHIFPRFNNDGFRWVSAEMGLQSMVKLQAEAIGLGDDGFV
ncbi:histidine triad (HIT) protein [Shewanella denitrificans OS217]|uniref:Histidine triad (HIT) protein n=1 Tax=Shewanella denitrificans (strain OS217 / ATCC BAA-1090 / DSM 15013) TaxID=318161 RepID=Q12JC0_SHEDO|nr:HIT family protein [Shewanella denitrificans]ABE56456.1 histidine triad (HIT) protein [Shewanella denitrificans OS217]